MIWDRSESARVQRKQMSLKDPQNCRSLAVLPYRKLCEQGQLESYQYLSCRAWTSQANKTHSHPTPQRSELLKKTTPLGADLNHRHRGSVGQSSLIELN